MFLYFFVNVQMHFLKEEGMANLPMGLHPILSTGFGRHTWLEFASSSASMVEFWNQVRCFVLVLDAGKGWLMLRYVKDKEDDGVLLSFVVFLCLFTGFILCLVLILD